MSSGHEPEKPGPSRRAILAGSTALPFLLGGAGVAAARQSGGASSPAVELKWTLLECLGGPWPDPGDLKPMVREAHQRDGYRLIDEAENPC